MLHFRFYMRIIKEIQMLPSDPSPFANCHIFSVSSLPWSVKYFMHGRKTFITPHSVIQRRSRLNYSEHAGCCSPIQELCLCWPLLLDTPCTTNYNPCHLSGLKNLKKLGFRFLGFFIFKSEFLLFHVKLCKFN